MTSVELWNTEPTASAVPTTTPSTTANGNDTIVPAADASSVKMPGRWTMTVCCAWTHVQIMMQRVRAKSIFFIMVDSFLVELKTESLLIPMKEYLFEK
jgi:hypothetical protein